MNEEEIDQLIQENSYLYSKVQYLIDMLDEEGMLPEHLFTFPDGETWEASPKE